MSPPIRLPVDVRMPPDPLEHPDLDEVMPGFADGSPIVWAAAIRLAEPGPEVTSSIPGVDWRITCLDEPFFAPAFNSDGDREDIQINPPVAVLSVDTGGATTVAVASERGRQRLRALIGYVHLRTPLLTGGTLEWEGPALKTSDGKYRFGSGSTQTYLSISDVGLEKIRQTLIQLELGRLDARHALALEWLADAWMPRSTPVRFVNLWVAVEVVVEPTFTRSQRKGTDLMDRIADYLHGLPLSDERRRDLEQRLRDAYSLRNGVVHRGERTAVTAKALGTLFDAVAEFIVTDMGKKAFG